MDNMRGLLVGGTTADAGRLAARLRPGATVICFARDRETGAALKQTLETRASGARVTVMLGDPWLLVHKVSGPFDVIVLPASGAVPAAARERVQTVLGEHGELDD